MQASSHFPLLLVGGALILLICWLPGLLKRIPLSLPIICVALGCAAAATDAFQLTQQRLASPQLAEKLSETVMLIALMGAGLRIDRRFGLRNWGTSWRLLLIAMPITMVAVFASARWGLGLSAAASLLLAGALAPTDPVLAGDVQTGPPGGGEDGETRFGLTSEAGFNDGLAFPFILLALALQAGSVSWGRWIGMDLIGELVIGGVVGVVLGRLMGAVMFRPGISLSNTGDGLVAIGATFLIYGATMLLHGNGFVAVFVGALAIRSSQREDDFHAKMADFAGQVERVLVMLVLVLFGWAVGRGLLASLTWPEAALAAALLLVFRPLASGLAFAGSSAPRTAKLLMGIFGIRGIGTIYYLLYAFQTARFAEAAMLWNVAGTAILMSIVVHGVLSTPLMQHADRLRARHGHKPDHPEFESAAT